MTELTRNEAGEFNDLCWNWESAYVIAFDGVFTAARMDGSGELLMAATPAGLRERIRDDYAAWQTAVLRDRATTE